MALQAALLFLGVLATSTSVIFIKASTLSPALLSGLRLVLASVVLSPIYFRARRSFPDEGGFRNPRRFGPPAIALAIHFLTWVVGARSTLAANASLIVNMVPLAMPFFLFFLANERLSRSEIVGTAIGLSGVFWLSGSDARADAAHLRGDWICFVSMLFYALYLSLGRRNRDVSSVWLYLVPLYATAGCICLLVGASQLATLATLPAREWLLILALTCIPTVLGHSFVNRAMKYFRGSTVSVCALAQFIFAGLLSWLVFQEKPKPAFWFAAALVTLGAGVALRGPKRELSPKPT